MALDDAIREILAIVGDVQGVRAAPEYATDKLPPGIFAMALPSSGVFRQAPTGVLQGLHSVELYVYCPRIDLAKTLKTLLPMGELVAAELEKNVTLNSTCQTFGDIEYTFSANINLGSETQPDYYSGWTFTVTGIKIEDTSILA